MDEQQNIALIQKVLEAFGRGDIAGILNSSTADAEFHCPGPAAIPYAGIRRGQAEIRGYFEQLLGTQKNQNLRIGQFVAQGDMVVAIGHYSAQVAATGKSIDSDVMLSFRIENGKIKKHLVLGDTAAVAGAYSAAAAAAR